MKAVNEFLRESYSELRKASWLNRQQLIGSTVAVVFLVSCVAAYVSAVDFVLSILLQAFMGR